jgi:3'(2'),5'-bisphosphate nucleotidase
MVSPIASAPPLVSPDTLDALVALAVRAGEAALQHYGGATAVERKADQSPVTAADRAAHAVIAAGLAARAPEVPVISEEGEGGIPPHAVRRSWTRFWLVDPLDGTKEFVQRNGEFTVNIALIEEGEPVLGVVHAPALGLTYWAGRGLGAWKREREGAPARIASSVPDLAAGLTVAESRSHPSALLDAWLRAVPVRRRVAAGSSLKFCWVAEGKADVYPRFGRTMEWDVAAGDCVFRQSGIAAPRRSPLRYNTEHLANDGFVIGLDELPIRVMPPASVLWFTGLSGAGKTTIARIVAARLRAAGARVEELDGDAIREIFPATGFSRAERDAHIKRVGYLASRLQRHGVFAIASLVSPYRESRDFVRRLCDRFVEIHVATPLDECERRDVKGLYARARRGEIAQFTGLDDPYEPPESPELTIDTRGTSAEQAADQVLAHLESGTA